MSFGFLNNIPKLKDKAFKFFIKGFQYEQFDSDCVYVKLFQPYFANRKNIIAVIPDNISIDLIIDEITTSIDNKKYIIVTDNIELDSNELVDKEFIIYTNSVPKKEYLNTHQAFL